MKALIAFEDGTVLTGRSFTGAGEAVGEIVFNTSMSGYQEILTDPSYTGQLVTMTYPLIGNYGVNPEDMESTAVHPRAFLMREYQDQPSNFRSTGTLADFLKTYNVLGVEGIDTRMLTRIIRNSGAMKVMVSTEDLDEASLVKRAQEWAGLEGRDMVARVSVARPYGWTAYGPAEGTGFPDISS
ncbi:MAG: carbamoyl phosphate synthase small subunit, partial [Desulfobulbus sp.]